MRKITILLLYAAAFACTVAQSENDLNGFNSICGTDICVQEAVRMYGYMDESVNPCDDFYQFACGKFVRETVIPAEKGDQNQFSIVLDRVVKQIQSVLTEEAKPNEPKPFKLAKIFTKTCLDEATLNEKGIMPMVEILEKYGGWPVVKGNDWKSDDWDWLEISKELSRDGLTEPIFNLYITFDLKNSSKRILTFDQPDLGLARKFLLKGFDHPHVKAYYDFMVDTAVIFGANQNDAENELLNSLVFESKLAEISLAEEHARELSIVDNAFTIADLQTIYPYINWLDYLNWKLNDLLRVDESEIVNVLDTNYFVQLDAVLRATPKRTIANYFAWRLVLSNSNLLNDVLHKRRQKYIATKTGKLKSRPRIKECVKRTIAYLPISAGALYVRKYFNEKSKNAAVTMAKDIHKEFIKTLQRVSWMDDESKKAAIKKAEAMVFHIGYPNELDDDSKLEDYYKDLELEPDSLILSTLRIKTFLFDRKIKKLHIAVNKTDWETHSVSSNVDAYYSLLENGILIPAATLQVPFFSSDRPAYLNFGGFGWFVAHEITHGFDDVGRQIDANGNHVNWWKDETVNEFTSRAKCFIEQYSNYTHPTLNLTVNGVLTQGENIADNGGIKGMYAAYQTYVGSNGNEPILPGMSYTTNQLFWISAAQTWCTATRPDFDIDLYTTNEHSPFNFRITGSFSNTHYFAKDFNCPSGSNMNSVNKCEIW